MTRRKGQAVSSAEPELPLAPTKGAGKRKRADVTELVCGVDEAGRGPLAGPVFAAAVILDPRRPIDGLRDSKKLSAARRDALAEQIRQRALAWSIAECSALEIDALNILQASMLAMQRAIDGLSVTPHRALIDGNRCPAGTIPMQAIVGGDDLVAEISAASILAKTARDAALTALHSQYPDYGFDQHKGYPTPLHLQRLRLHGVSPVHRKSYAPVRALLDGEVERYENAWLRARQEDLLP